MQQYWKFKEHNFDKVLFFKLGKFYEMFFDDAIIGNRVLDLNWMGNDPKKLHVGFPEKGLEEKAAKLVDIGFKVIIDYILNILRIARNLIFNINKIVSNHKFVNLGICYRTNRDS